MPTIPAVYLPVRSNDVGQRSFKAFKSYQITSASYSSSGASYLDGIHSNINIDVGDPTVSYPTNSFDGTNQFVVWKSIDHKFYEYPYDPGKTFEHSNATLTKKFHYISSSILSLPYLDVGEQIKPGTLRITASKYGTSINLIDDGFGNLRDIAIDSASFASSSRCYMYMSFNDEIW